MEVKHFEEYDCVYDDKNNLIEVYEDKILTCRYKYNSHSKVIREDNLLLKESIIYEYNNFDKLTQRKIYDYSLDNLQNVKHIDKFEYDNKNQNKLISYNNEFFSYNKKGNAYIFRNAKLKISKSHCLLKLDTYSFKYNKNKCRTKKVIGEYTTKFYMKNNLLVKQDNGIILYFTYKNNKLSGFKFNNETYFYKKNFNDDIVGIYNHENILICRYVYDCFGNHNLIVNDISKISYKIADLNPFRFHSNYFDIETGLYFTNGNYYDPEIDCFLNK